MEVSGGFPAASPWLPPHRICISQCLIASATRMLSQLLRQRLKSQRGHVPAIGTPGHNHEHDRMSMPTIFMSSLTIDMPTTIMIRLTLSMNTITQIVIPPSHL